MRTDLSVILNLHNETEFLKRTFASLRQAAAYASAQGITIELVVVLDNSPAAARDWVQSYPYVEYAKFQIVEVDNRSLGLSRNAGISAASGDYIATADADDLVSYNFFSALYDTARAEGPDSIVCAQHACSFGDASYWRVYSGSDVISPIALFGGNPFASRILAHRSVFEKIPYQDSPNEVSAFEDWHFNCEAIASGYRYCIAPDAILFYRQRADSIMGRSRNYIMRYSRLFSLNLYEKYCDAANHNIAQTTNSDSAGLPGVRDLLSSALVTELVLAAGEIDPAINLERIATAPVGYARTTTISPGCAYYECVQHIHDKVFTDVFVMSYDGVNLAGQKLLAIARRQIADDPQRRILLIQGMQNLPDAEILQSDQITVVNLYETCQKWHEAQDDLLALRLIQTVGKHATLHLDAGSLTFRVFRQFSAALENGSRFYYFRQLLTEVDTLSDSDAFNFLSECSGCIESILVDNPKAIEFLDARLQLHAGQRIELMPDVIEFSA